MDLRLNASLESLKLNARILCDLFSLTSDPQELSLLKAFSQAKCLTSNETSLKVRLNQKFLLSSGGLNSR